MIAIIDYGAGNLRSVQKALAAAGASGTITTDPGDILAARGLVLPGVGAFGDGMRGLAVHGLDRAIRQAVQQGTPLLGICLGMQLLFEAGEELGSHRGLGLLPGVVRRLPDNSLKVPHNGWNRLLLQRPSGLLRGVRGGDYAYFNHSYYCLPADPRDVLSVTSYGPRFASAVQRGRVFGLQWHPEKSQALGLKVMENFLRRCIV